MAEVATSWNGLSDEYKVTMEDHYGFSWEESSGVPPMGEASFMPVSYTHLTLPTILLV